MKLETKNTEILGNIGTQTKKAKISIENIHKQWAAIENPYKNNIGSIVREICSNAVDAQADSGILDAVIVKFTKEDDGFYISFIDQGTGMSEQLMDDIYLEIYASTKELSDKYIGAFGIGSKSPLSYQSHFFINTHVDGTTYNYIYRKGQIEPELDILTSFKEDRRNGTEIKLKIKNEYDLKQFIRECNKQLYYFENVVFDYKVLENYLSDFEFRQVEANLNNDFKIYEGNNYKVRINNNLKENNKPFNRIHICNGPVAYPIDFNNIEVENALGNIPIGLKFNIGELDVIQTREDVRYTDKTIKAIKSKLEAVKKELVDMASQTPEVIHDNYQEYIRDRNQPKHIKLGKDDYIFVIQSSILPNTKHYLKGFYKIDKNYNPEHVYKNLLSKIEISDSINYTESGTIRLNKNFQNRIGNGRDSFYPHTILYYNKDRNLGTILIKSPDSSYSVKKNKQLVFKDNLIVEDYQLPVFIDHSKNRNLKWFINALDLKSTDKGNWRKLINFFIKIEEKWLNEKLTECYNIIWYDDYKLDEKWYSDFAKSNRKEVEKRDTTKMSFMFRQQYYSTDAVWDNQNLSIDQLLFKQGKKPNQVNSYLHDKILIVTEKDNKDVLLRFDHLLSSNRMITTAALAPRNLEKLMKFVKENNITNVYTYREFRDNKNNVKMQFTRKLYKYYILDNNFKIIKNSLDFGSPYDKNIQTLFPKVGEVIDKYDQMYEDLKYEFVFVNNHQLKRYFSTFQMEEKEIIDYVNEHDGDFLNDINKLEEFFNLFKNVVPNYSYYSEDSITLNSFATFLYYYKPYSTFALLNPEIRVPTDEEFEMLVNINMKPKGEEGIIFNYLIYFYLIKNRLPLTTDLEKLKEIKI